MGVSEPLPTSRLLTLVLSGGAAATSFFVSALAGEVGATGFGGSGVGGGLEFMSLDTLRYEFAEACAWVRGAADEPVLVSGTAGSVLAAVALL